MIDHLQKLLEGRHGLDTVANRNIVGDMAVTLKSPDEEPASPLEASIDSLIDLDVDGYWPGYRSDHFSFYAGEDSGYHKLREEGFEAVPTLIKHLHDFRLTRSLASSDNYVWHVRIADVAGTLLKELNPQGFAYDFHLKRGRGRSLDENHVLHWWTSAKNVSVLDYLLANAVTSGTYGQPQGNATLLSMLGRRFPDQFADHFLEWVEKADVTDELFMALAASQVPKDEKMRLLRTQAENKNTRKRHNAIRYLLSFKHPEAVPLFIQELEKLPRTAAESMGHTEARGAARLLTETDDDRAWQAFLTNARRVDVAQRLEMIEGLTAGQLFNPERAIAALAQFLDDQETRIGRVSLFNAGGWFDRLSIQDFAALKLARHLGIAADEHTTWKEEDWAKLRERVQDELIERGVLEQKKQKP